MKALLFTGTSNVGWVHSFATGLKYALEKRDVECMLIHGEFINFDKLGSTIDGFKPDFSLSINQLHTHPPKGSTEMFYDRFKLPHYLYLVDHPLIWLASDTINFDSPYLNVITIDNKQTLLDAGVTRCEEILYGCPACLENSVMKNRERKNGSLFFAGTLQNPAQELGKVNGYSFFSMEQKKAVFEFCQSLYDDMAASRKFFKESIQQRFREKYTVNGIFDKSYFKNSNILRAYLDIERFYENLARDTILNGLKKTNISCVLAGDATMQQFCSGAPNLHYVGTLHYDTFMQVISQMAVHLNSTPKHLHVHDRITSTLLSGSLLVTTPVPKLVEKHPELKDIIIQAEFGDMSFVKEMEQVLVTPGEYERRIDAGVELARKYFTWDTTAEKIIDFVNRTK